MTRVKVDRSIFSKKLIAFRKAKGLTQIQLAKLINSTQRTISYYENQAYQPPAHILIKLAKILDVKIEDFLEDSPIKQSTKKNIMDSETKRLWKKFQQIIKLPERDKRAILRMINSLGKNKK